MKWRDNTCSAPSRESFWPGFVEWSHYARCSLCPEARPSAAGHRQRPVAAVGARCRPRLCVCVCGCGGRGLGGSPRRQSGRLLPLSGRCGGAGADPGARCGGAGADRAGRGRGRSAPPPRRCRSAVRCRRGRPGGAAAGRCGGLGRGGSERARLAAARARRPPALPGRTREIPLAMQTRRRLLPPE
ncbi:uncharacterized protein GJ701_007863 [Geothlypis trichas]